MRQKTIKKAHKTELVVVYLYSQGEKLLINKLQRECSLVITSVGHYYRYSNSLEYRHIMD